MMSGAKKRVPKRRFKEFLNAGDWEQYKLADILSRRKENRRIDSAYPRLAFAAGQGVIPLSERRTNNRDQLISDEKTKKYLVTYYNDIVYNPANLKYGAIDRNKYGQGVISPIYVTFTSNICSGFIEHIVKSHEFKEKALSFEEGTVTKRQAVNPDNLLKIDVVITPNSKEQEKISKLFELIDRFITLHQHKLDKLEATKKALLQEMFPEEGQDKPKRRFKGFTDAWEQRKLNDFVTIRRGLTYKPSDIAENGIRVLRSSNIDEDQFIKSNDDVFVNIDAVNIPFAKNGDILITSANGSSRLVGKHTIINDIAENSAVHGGFMLLAESNNPLFTDALLSSNWYKRFINTYVAGGNGAIGNLSKSDLESQSVMVPSEHEQIKIGQWYGSINQLITLHQRKLDKLKNLKQAYLNEMFV